MDKGRPMTATLQRIFQRSFQAYAAERSLPIKQHKAAHAIMSCRTPEQGGHIQRCPDNHESHIQYHSCHHRSCPQCNGLTKEQWVQKQYSRMLDVDHYHLIFTLPHEFLPVWRYNKRWFAHALFSVVRDTLLELSKDKKYMGAQPGLLLSLHTWGRNLSLHPHIHCLMTGGGITQEGQWQSVKNSYLLPSRVVCALYKGKFLSLVWSAFHAKELIFPSAVDEQSFPTKLKQMGKKKWHVRIQPPYTHGRGVIKYLARYVKGGPIGNHRIIAANENHITFSYKDLRDGKQKTHTFTPHQFIERILEHVAEPRQHTVRHCGLYGLHARNRRNLCREQLGQPAEEKYEAVSWIDYLAQLEDPITAVCSKCGKALVRGGEVSKISINRVRGSGYVQLAVQADAATSAATSKFPAYNDSSGDSCTETAQLN